MKPKQNLFIKKSKCKPDVIIYNVFILCVVVWLGFAFQGMTLSLFARSKNEQMSHESTFSKIMSIKRNDPYQGEVSSR